MGTIKVPIHTAPHVMISSDYSQQEPKLTAFVSGDEKMIQAFKDKRDIYATIASLAFNLPYEKCLEFHPETGEYQPDGKARRGEAKTIVLGITYGRSVVTIADQLFGTNDNMTDEEKVKKAQNVYDSVLNAFPNLRALMISAQTTAKTRGYVETILGRRRHIPDMQLPEFEFVPMKGYVNPDVNPLDVSTLSNASAIPERIVAALTQEFKSYKYYGQIARRTRELYENDKIKVINNRPKINDASRQCVNCVDEETEILTTHGWKTYEDVHVGDEILAYDMDKLSVVKDHVRDIIVSDEPVEMVEFKHRRFSAVSTLNHRWITSISHHLVKAVTTEEICNSKSMLFHHSHYSILRCAGNKFEDNSSWSDDELRLLNFIMTYAAPFEGRECDSDADGFVHFYYLDHHPKLYRAILSVLKSLQVSCCDASLCDRCHIIVNNRSPIVEKILDLLPEGVLTYDFIFSLSQHQAEVLMQAMIEYNGVLLSKKFKSKYACDSAEKKDLFQALCFVAGHASCAHEVVCDDIAYDDEQRFNKNYIDALMYSNNAGVHYWVVDVLNAKNARVDRYFTTRVEKPMCWCVQTDTHTWIARRHDTVYITGNSIIQGSAADQTKLAMLMLENNEEWLKLGGRLLLPVHDELIAEVPMESWEAGGKLLSSIMCEAANFLPFPSKCDVTTTLRWYGLSYPCVYPRPKSLNNMTSDEVKWVQYHLCELEYELPVLLEADGSKPRGDAASGVNGVVTPEFESAIANYRLEHHLTTDAEFISHIDRKVMEGV